MEWAVGIAFGDGFVGAGDVARAEGTAGDDVGGEQKGGESREKGDGGEMHWVGGCEVRSVGGKERDVIGTAVVEVCDEGVVGSAVWCNKWCSAVVAKNVKRMRLYRV